MHSLSTGVKRIIGPTPGLVVRVIRHAEVLPTTVLSSRADSTTRKYLGAFKRWKLWAEARQGVPVFPVQEIHLALLPPTSG
jgi:hypothetical protein